MRQLIIKNLFIRIYTVSNPVIDLGLKPLFVMMDVSKFRDGIVHFINSGVKGLMISAQVKYQLMISEPYAMTQLHDSGN